MCLDIGSKNARDSPHERTQFLLPATTMAQPNFQIILNELALIPNLPWFNPQLVQDVQQILQQNGQILQQNNQIAQRMQDLEDRMQNLDNRMQNLDNQMQNLDNQMQNL